MTFSIVFEKWLRSSNFLTRQSTIRPARATIHFLATRDRVLRLIIGEGVKVAAFGIGIGLLGGLALGRAVSSLVFGVPVRDPATFIAVAVALAAVAFAACTVPALRASRVDPMVALRYE